MSAFSNGVELITKERYEQIHKHGWTKEHDVVFNDGYQLTQAAEAILSLDSTKWPFELDIFEHIISKPIQERLAVAGAFVAAEIDRIDSITPKTINNGNSVIDSE